MHTNRALDMFKLVVTRSIIDGEIERVILSAKPLAEESRPGRVGLTRDGLQDFLGKIFDNNPSPVSQQMQCLLEEESFTLDNGIGDDLVFNKAQLIKLGFCFE